MSPRYVRVGGYINDDPYTPDEEPTDEELGWWDEDDIPVNIFGETEEEPE